jgi:hypothetical protein
MNGMPKAEGQLLDELLPDRLAGSLGNDATVPTSVKEAAGQNGHRPIERFEHETQPTGDRRYLPTGVVKVLVNFVSNVVLVGKISQEPWQGIMKG